MGRVCVVGLGYIGLPTAAILAKNGVEVVGVDVNPKHVDAVNAGQLPFVEEGLGEVVADVVAKGLLSAQATTPASEVYIVAVPTPFRDEYQVDVKYIDAATDGIIPQLSGGELLVLESTSPPGTTEHMRDRVLAARPELEGKVDFSHAPERVLPGRMMEEIVTNDRVIGGITPQAAERTRDLYAVFCKGDLFLTDARTAELSKLAENSFRDVNIAFANELSLICDQLGVNVWELIELANKHPRVNILQPGPGVGGHCIAVDPWFIVSSAPTLSRLIRTAREVNDGKPAWVIDQVYKALAETPTARIAALGLAFKPDIDDLRESPALNIADQLATELGEDALLVVEPNVPELPARLAGRNIQLVGLDEALAQADLVVLLVDHKEFKELPAERLTGKRVIDTRGTWRDLA